MGEIQIYKSPTDNSLEFEIDIGPDNDAYNDYNLTEILEFTGADIEITQAYYENGKLIIKTNYSEDLVGL